MKTGISKTVATVLTFAAILAAAFVYAVDQSNSYYAYGPGQQSCEDYVKLREKKLDTLEQQHERYTKDELYDMADRAVEYWIAGFLTAHDLYVADTFNVAGNTKMDDLKARLENICRSNGKQHFAEAMFRMVQQLHPGRVKAHTGK